MEQNLTNQTLQCRPNIANWITHYTHLFWRWKWYIILTLPTLVVVWFLLAVTFGKIRPDVTTSVLLGLENPTTILSLPEASRNGLGKMKLLQSEIFLGEIVDTLSLNLVLPKFNRSAVFSSMKVDTSAQRGKYKFLLTGKNEYVLFFYDEESRLEKKSLISGTILSLDTLHFNGINIHLAPEYLKNPFNFDFYIVKRQDAVEDLKKRLVIQGNPRRDPMQEGVVVISISGTDPMLISLTVNTIAENFIHKNLSFRKRKTTEILKSLQTQLRAASLELLKDEEKVRVFREENPDAGLGIDIQNAITNISLLESNNMSISNEIDEANSLINTLLKQTGSENEFTAGEALLFLSNHQMPGAIILQQDFNTLLQQKMSLISNRYSPDHPIVKDVQTKIDDIKAKTVPLIREFITKQEKGIAQGNTQKSLHLGHLKTLPQKEMQLAALIRQQQINADIYSTILTKYNQAKIADETEVSDIYIMDYSVPPEEEKVRKELIKLVAIGLFVCLLLSFGPPVIVDKFDSRIRSENDIRRLMNLALLETIPQVRVKNRSKKKNSGSDNNLDPKLVTYDKSIPYIHELFRSLRTKLNFRMEITKGKSLLVTSYDAGEGKSLISSNIAVIASQQHMPLLLIDGDLHRGTLHKIFSVNNNQGLSDLITSHQQLTDPLIQSYIKQTAIRNLFLMTCGNYSEDSGELFTSSRFKAIIQWVTLKFAITIIDTPPLLPISDSVMLSNSISGVLLVIRAGKTNATDLIKILNEYPDFSEKILGVVLNGVDKDKNYRKYTGYYCHYSAKQKKSENNMTNYTNSGQELHALNMKDELI
jgi:tyrosine-protein kinase Etk/Wzc